LTFVLVVLTILLVSLGKWNIASIDLKVAATQQRALATSDGLA